MHWFRAAPAVEEEPVDVGQPQPAATESPAAPVASEGVVELDDVDEDFVLVEDDDRHLHEMQQQLSELRQEVHQVKTKVAALVSQEGGAVVLHQKEVEFRDRQLEEKELKLREMQRQLGLVERSNNMKLAQLDTECRGKTQALMQREEQLKKVKVELQRMRTGNEQLNVQIKQTKDLIKQITGQIHAAQQSAAGDDSQEAKEAAELEDSLRVQQQEGHAAETTATSLEAGTACLQQALHAAEVEWKAEVEQLATLYANESFAAHEKNLREQSAQTAKLRLMAEESERKLKEEESKVKFAEGETTRIIQINADLRKRIHSTEARKTLTIRELEEEVRRVQVKKAQLETSATSTTATLQRIKEENTRMQGELDQSQAEQARKEKEHEKELVVLRTGVKEIREKLQTQNREAAEEISGLQAEVADKTKVREEMTAKTQKIGTEVDALKEALRLRQKEVEKLQNRLADRQRAVQRMQVSVEEITRDVAGDPEGRKSGTVSNRQRAVMEILAKNPSSIPVRCVRAEGCDYPPLPRKKFAVIKDITLSQFNHYVRGKLDLDQDAPLSVFVEASGRVPATEVMSELYDKCRQEDGFLHLRYSHQSQ